LEKEKTIYWKFKKGKCGGFAAIINDIKPELAKEKAQEYFKRKILAELKRSEEKNQFNLLHRKHESIELQLQMLKRKNQKRSGEIKN
jgi:hypothetical protein